VSSRGANSSPMRSRPQEFEQLESDDDLSRKSVKERRGATRCTPAAKGCAAPSPLRCPARRRRLAERGSSTRGRFRPPAGARAAVGLSHVRSSAHTPPPAAQRAGQTSTSAARLATSTTWISWSGLIGVWLQPLATPPPSSTAGTNLRGNARSPAARRRDECDSNRSASSR